MKFIPIDIYTYSSLNKQQDDVFTSSDWLSIYEKNISFVGIYKDDNQIIGGFFYLKTKKFASTFIKLPPYTPHCGLIFYNEGKNISTHNNNNKEIISGVCNYFNTLKSSLTVLAFPNNVKDLQPFIWNNYKVVPNYTFQINLNKSIEEIVKNFDSKNRNTINKAIKDGIYVEENTLSGNELSAFFISTLTTANANIYTNELKNIFEKFSKPTNSFCKVAKFNNKIIGVVFCVFDNKTCYYLMGGTLKEQGINGVNNLLILKAIEKAKNLGCEIFDFEGSMLIGVEKFFRSFGGELIPYYTANKGKLAIEILLKFKKRHLF